MIDSVPDESADDLVEVVRARGHENVTAEHVSTLEFTSDDFLTPAGDCILAVEADRVPADFDDAFRDVERTGLRRDPGSELLQATRT